MKDDQNLRNEILNELKEAIRENEMLIKVRKNIKNYDTREQELRMAWQKEMLAKYNK